MDYHYYLTYQRILLHYNLDITLIYGLDYKYVIIFVESYYGRHLEGL